MSRAWHTKAPEGEVVLVPRTQPTAKRAVLYAHQNGANARTVLSGGQPYFDVVPDALHAPLIASDDGGTATWGNDTALAAKSTLFGNLPTMPLGVLTDKAVLYGGSMGTIVNWNWARANLSKVAAIVSVIGIPDVEAARAANRNSVAQSLVETAYTNNAGWQTARPTHNPIEFAASLAGIPMLDFYSDDDPFSTPAEHQAFAAAVGSSCTTVSMGAVGHTFFGLDVGRLRDFIAQYV